ncbi:MAG: hypothetical protein GYB65_11080 [Chloroflexi bacterium]|nr:hypothetical protein [Chloroflexota bacterium]
MEEQKTKDRSPHYTAEFLTALHLAACRERLERDGATEITGRGLGPTLAPIQQTVTVKPNDEFVIERGFPWAIQPIRFVGYLDHDEDGKGTWVHGTITHDTYNQVLIEGMIIFMGFFVLTVLFFLRLKVRALAVSLPLLLILLLVFSARWRTLRRSTEGVARWVRRKLYLTAEQVNKR